MFSKSPIESLRGDMGERQVGTRGNIFDVFRNDRNFADKIRDNYD